MTATITTRELTDRELEVLVGVVDGLTNGEIGKRLYLSEDTVKSHLVRVLRKLGVTNRASAVREGLCRGLVTVPGVVLVGMPSLPPDPRPCHPQHDPSIGTVTLRADDHDAAHLASAIRGGLPVAGMPETARLQALDAIRRLAGTATG
ncbi:helix-turn-helix domain-containing protein [Actinomycetospora aeridis]|uniref:Helix-turn-helix transcriptional regulator n=1 Tax=Actinomycetospora aeridis TaxID=3129231 RepID=A0ABU8N1K4_9PSEU